MNKLKYLSRTASVLLLIASIFAWAKGIRFKDSELLATMLPSLFGLALGYLGLNRLNKRNLIGILGNIGFFGNVIMIAICALIILGFGIVP